MKNIFFESLSENNDSLNGKFKHVWVEDSISINSKKDEYKKLGTSHTNRYVNLNLDKKKIVFISFALLLGLSIIFSKVFYTQIVKGNEYYSLAEGNRIRLRPIQAERGIIYDRNGKELVQNVPSFSLLISPRDLPKDQTEKWEVLQKIGEISEKTSEELSDLIKKYGNYYYETLMVQEDLDYDSAIKIHTQNSNLPGVMIQSNTKRKYIYTENQNNKNVTSMSHVIGYLGKLTPDELEKLKEEKYEPSDSIGKVGIEKQYEKDLRGSYGQKKIEVDALGKEQSVLAEEPPMPGKNLTLTIDIDIQNKLEEILQNQLKKIGKKRAAALVINPQNGEVIAMVNVPSYNNNDFSGGISNVDYEKYTKNKNNPLFNRVIGGTYPSGSTIKPVVAIAALAEGIITPNTSFLSNGGLQINKWFFPDWKAGGHGYTNVRKAIAWSVNTFFYYIGGGYKEFEGLGLEKIVKYFYDFNLGKKTEIDLPGEGTGFLPSREWKKKIKNESWYVGDTYNISIGQGDVLVSPLQIGVLTSAVVNNGKVIKPHLVKESYDPNTKLTTTTQTVILNEPEINKSYITIAKEGMKQCVTDGSCGMLRSLNFTSGGKTGTAQWSSVKETHAWFTAFAPYNTPQVTVVVLIEEGGGGATVCMPPAYEFLKWWGENYLK